MNTRHLLWLALVLAGFAPPSAQAQVVSQAITLRPGWNSVWLEVTPALTETGTVFQGLPVKNVWRLNDDTSPVRFIFDASQLMPDKDGWLTWTPATDSKQVLNTLLKITGGHAYLVELEGSTNRTLTVKGQPVVKPLSWLSASYSLTGLCVDPAANVTFTQFFTGSSAHTGQDIRRLQANGTWASTPQSSVIQRGEAYFIFCNANSSWQGPAYVEADARGLLDYGASIVELSVNLCNNSAASVNFSLNLLPGSSAPGTTAGPVALSLWRDGSAYAATGNAAYGWEPFTAAKTVTVLSKTKKTVRLAIRRVDMTGQGASLPFESLLQATGAGVCTNVALRADGFAAGTFGSGAASRYAGLWVGMITINAVNEPAGASPNTLQPTAQQAQLRMLVRVDASGQAQLLHEATIYWVDGVSAADGTLVEAGRYVVTATPTELAGLVAAYGNVNTGRLKGSVVRDAQVVPRRISSVGFSNAAPLALTGTFGSSLTGTVNVGFNDDLNPYKHRYHPDHDNLKDGSKRDGAPVVLPAGQESYDIARQITLTFTATDPENGQAAGWGDNTLGGTYAETITGLHRNPVKAGGTFRLVRAVAAGN